jgi:hypothetical protein
MSADATTVEVTVALLFPGVGSGTELLAVALFVTVVPANAKWVRLATRVKLAEAPLAKLPLVQLTATVPAGVEQVNAGPAVCVHDTKTRMKELSVRVAIVVLGPLFVIVTL